MYDEDDNEEDVPISSKLRDKFREKKNMGMEKYEDMREKFLDKKDQFEDFISDHPLESTIVAVLVGYLIGSAVTKAKMMAYKRNWD